MIVKIFSRGKGGGSAPVDYLCGKDPQADGISREVTREGAEVLKGDPEITRQLIDSADFSRRYTAGVLSFAEQADSVPEAQQREIMERFEECMFSGLEADQYDILWVRHTDKGGRLELNFLVPNVELQSGKRLQPYYDRIDRPRFNALKNIINHEYGFADPNDPERQRPLATAKDLPRDKKEAAEKITQAIETAVLAGQIKNRNDVVDYLNERGLKVVRTVKSSISIADPEGGKNLRLRGAFYEQSFRVSEELRADIEQRARDYRNAATERYNEDKRNYQQRIERIRERNAKQYPRSQGQSREQVKQGIEGVEHGMDRRIIDVHGVPNHHQPVAMVQIREPIPEQPRSAETIRREREERGDSEGRILRTEREKSPLRGSEDRAYMGSRQQEKNSLFTAAIGGSNDRNREIITQHTRRITTLAQREHESIKRENERIRTATNDYRGSVRANSETIRSYGRAIQERRRAIERFKELYRAALEKARKAAKKAQEAIRNRSQGFGMGR